MLTIKQFFWLILRHIVVMNKSSQGNAVVVVFEWNDKDLIGKRDNETGEVRPSSNHSGFFFSNIMMRAPNSKRPLEGCREHTN